MQEGDTVRRGFVGDTDRCSDREKHDMRLGHRYALKSVQMYAMLGE